jgi:hypothetical protein
MEVIARKGSVQLIGILNEDFRLEEFDSALTSAANACVKVSLDFGDVPRANSCGIATLLRVLSSTQVVIEMERCPVWLVEQMNQIDEFLEATASVKSVYAPYISTNSDDYMLRLIEIPQGFLSSEEFQTIEKFEPSAGKQFIADFEKDDFFYFLRRQK